MTFYIGTVVPHNIDAVPYVYCKVQYSTGLCCTLPITHVNEYSIQSLRTAIIRTVRYGAYLPYGKADSRATIHPQYTYLHSFEERRQ